MVLQNPQFNSFSSASDWEWVARQSLNTVMCYCFYIFLCSTSFFIKKNRRRWCTSHSRHQSLSFWPTFQYCFRIVSRLLFGCCYFYTLQLNNTNVEYDNQKSAEQCLHGGKNHTGWLDTNEESVWRAQVKSITSSNLWPSGQVTANPMEVSE